MTQPIEIQFRKAVKFDARGRVALFGPAGSGKSLTTLKLARLLAGPTGRIAAIDTEHGTLSKYADEEEFDVFELESYSPDNFIASLEAAERNKYDVFICDSLSHFWIGKDGAFDFVDEKKKRAASRGGDQMDGWKEFRPHERQMVDRMLASPCHVIVTMRTKNEYINEEYTTSRGEKKTRRLKIGLAPVQRDGLEYEFDLCGLMTTDNELVIDKTRCSHYAGKTLVKPSPKDFEPFAAWLKGAPAAKVAAPQQTQVVLDWRALAGDAFGRIESRIGRANLLNLLGKLGYTSLAELPDRGTALKVYDEVEKASVFYTDVAGSEPNQAAAHEVPVPQRKAPATAQPPTVPEPVQSIWKSMTNAASIASAFESLRREFADLAGEERAMETYLSCLASAGIENASQFKSIAKARQCLLNLWLTVDALRNAECLEMRGAA